MKIQHAQTFHIIEIPSVTSRKKFFFYNAATFAKVTVFAFSNAETLQYNVG